jgi:restriction system protein
MAVPAFSAYLDPVLAALADGELHRNADLKSAAAERLRLSADDLRELVSSGQKTRHLDRTYWAITYLFQAGLVERPGRGLIRITARGKEVLSGAQRPIGMATLEQFDEFRAFKGRRSVGGEAIPLEALDVATAHVSPVEAVADLVDSVNEAVARDLLLRIIAQTPDFLERLVLRLLRALGYGGLEATSEHLGGPRDEGLDGVIRQDALGLDVVYVQAKRYAAENKVGRPDIQAFVGALTGAQATRGVFITTSSFTTEARTYADRVGLRLVLIDGQELARLLVERNIGVSVEETFDLKRIDEDFFDV